MNNHDPFYLLKFYRKPQPNMLPQAVRIIKFLFIAKNNSLKFLFPSIIIEWRKLDLNIASLTIDIKKLILKFLDLILTLVFNVHGIPRY